MFLLTVSPYVLLQTLLGCQALAKDTTPHPLTHHKEARSDPGQAIPGFSFVLLEKERRPKAWGDNILSSVEEASLTRPVLSEVT